MKFLTAGESHGKALIGIIQGIPSGLEISSDYINAELYRRQQGYGRGGRMRIETDKAIILSGVRHGKTLGSPIAIMINNKDNKNWLDDMSVDPIEKTIKKITLPRPGHADLAGIKKYDFDDIRNVIERSSARETAMRVALGAVCKKFLLDANINISSRVISIGSVIDNTIIENYENLNDDIDNSPLRCYNKNIESKMIDEIDKCNKKGDTIGGKIELIATGLPYGLGSYIQWDKKISTIISSLLLSINAFKSLTIGSELGVLGSDYHDEISWSQDKFKRESNSAGGIEGGMSNTNPIILTMEMKPLSTLRKSLKSSDIKTKQPKSAHKERSDVCAVPAASIVAEGMLSFALADSLLDKFGGDSMKQFKAHLDLSAKY
ncbi:chorismate synthase [bacterium]|nr:chorismate synthase [bacterium]